MIYYFFFLSATDMQSEIMEKYQLDVIFLPSSAVIEKQQSKAVTKPYAELVITDIIRKSINI